ncbi:hypothetical protein [Fibrella aquatica]|uniref:hypothetical protein n=1 Tax=Fibrella aquatica TaxID=3242487 RepID=UPI0035204555
MKLTQLLTASLLLASSMAWAQVQPMPGNPDYDNSASRNAYNLMRESTYNRYVTFNGSIRYGVSMPMGTSKNYIDKLSPANVIATMEWQFPQKFSLGLQTGYQYSQQRLPRAIYDLGEETISAVQTRTLTLTPVMATASYYFSDPASAIRPYVQIAGGGAFVNYTNFYGTLSDANKKFAGAIAPAIGLKVFGQRESRLGGEVQAQYQNVFYNYNEINNAQNVMLSAGLTYRFY